MGTFEVIFYWVAGDVKPFLCLDFSVGRADGKPQPGEITVKPVRKVVTRSPKRNVGLVNCPWFQELPIQHESRLEKHFVLRAMLFPGLISIHHQPFHMPLAEHGKRYTPDFLLTFSNGERLVFEVKRSERIKEQKARFGEIATLCRQSSLQYFVVHQGQIEGQRRAERAALIRRYAMHGLDRELTQAVICGISFIGNSPKVF